MTVVKTECSPSTSARAFGTLADRLTESAKQATKPGHLAQDIADYEVQAGRLLVQAIDGGLFPKEHCHVNLGWWDRSIARIPGCVMTIYGCVPNWAITEMKFGEAKVKLVTDPGPDAEQRIRADAAKPFEPAQFARCWLFAVGSWLAAKFPERFRHNAASWDWWTAATDSDGRPLGKDGKPLTRRWYWNGERMPDGWKPPFEQDGQARLTPEEQEVVLGNLSDEEMQKWREPDPSADHFELKLEAEIAGTTDFYDDADWMKHQRIRAEVHSDACRLLDDLIRANDCSAAMPGSGGALHPLQAITKERMRREVAHPLIACYLGRRPHDTSQDVADAIGCSKGVVIESPAWKANRKRLADAKQSGRDPIALPLVDYLAPGGANDQSQMHAHKRLQEAQDEEIDDREKALNQRIAEYEAQHPDDDAQSVAKAVGCTAGEVERRRAALANLTAEQAECQKEDSDDPSGKAPKPIRKRV
jgi:hypothetical protein